MSDAGMRFGAEWTRLRGYLARVGIGPEGSRALTREQARDALEIILRGGSTEAQAASFLLAMRMKRETLEENQGFLDALRGATAAVCAQVPVLCDLGDPYDGGLRYLHMTTFVPAVLAACGLPALVHGTLAMPPKWGLGHARVLAAAGAPVRLGASAAARRIEDPEVGWAYLDQADACPALHALGTLRADLAKRPALATLEKLVGPVRAAGRTLLVSGYVHHGYEDLMAAVAREPARFDAALVLHGLEGWCELPLDRPATTVGWRFGEAGPQRIERRPQDAGLEVAPGAPDPQGRLGGIWKGAAARGPANVERAAGDDDPAGPTGLPEPVLAAAAAATLAAGREVLGGERNAARTMLLYTAALALHQAGIAESLRAAAELAASAIDGGQAAARFEGYVRF